MSVLFNVLNIARHALLANQKALAITSQNIANVNTKGYARQEVVFGAFATANGEVPTDHQGALGMGVLISDVRRAGGGMNTVLEERIAAGESNLGRLRARDGLFNRIESILNDASATGLNRVMSDFFNAASDLSAVLPGGDDAAQRAVLLERARALARRFVSTDTRLNEVDSDIDAEVTRLLREVNAQTAQIAHLNDLIATATSSGQQTNELRNQRRLLLNDLAEKIGFTSVEDPLNLGKITLTIDSLTGASPTALVQAGTNQILSTTRPLTEADITANLKSGRLAGLANMRDVVLPAFKADLDLLASRLVAEVNSRHSVGFNTAGVTGLPLFSGTTAGTMGVAVTAPEGIAASSVAGLPGDNQIMRNIVTLQNTLVVPEGTPTDTLQNFYNSVIARLGAEAQDATSNLSAENAIQDELVSLRDTNSGVSLDNELINVVKYQRAFEAAARLVTVTDEMLLTLINLKR